MKADQQPDNQRNSAGAPLISPSAARSVATTGTDTRAGATASVGAASAGGVLKPASGENTGTNSSADAASTGHTTTGQRTRTGWRRTLSAQTFLVGVVSAFLLYECLISTDSVSLFGGTVSAAWFTLGL
ncbi:MAG: hypothetical protein KDA89_02260, partial [Planctomycetaceae bacterium]|nr:hypothetical protein [Planctomycetaceae bacterium]